MPHWRTIEGRMGRVVTGREAGVGMDEEKKSVSWRWILVALIGYPIIGYIAFLMLFGNPY